MQMKMKQLKQIVREGLRQIREDYEVADDTTVDLEDPTVMWNHMYDMDDQETSTRLANARINMNDVDTEEQDELDKAIKKMFGANPLTNEAKKARAKDSNGCTTRSVVDRYAKSKTKYSEPEMSLSRAARTAKMEAKAKYQAGYQGERDDDIGHAKKRKRMRAQQLKGKNNPMRGPVINRRQPKMSGGTRPANFAAAAKIRQKGAKVSEDRYPDKDGWQGELYRGNRGAGGGRKKARGKKQVTPVQRMKKEAAYSRALGYQGEKYRAGVSKKRKKDKARSIPPQNRALKEKSPPGWEGTVKAMKRDKKKGKNSIDNPWALSWYMKGKGDKSHYTKKGKKKKHEGVESDGTPRVTLPKLPKDKKNDDQR
jgi:hypothetical protein